MAIVALNATFWKKRVQQKRCDSWEPAKTRSEPAHRLKLPVWPPEKSALLGNSPTPETAFSQKPLVSLALRESHLFVCTRFWASSALKLRPRLIRRPFFCARKVVFHDFTPPRFRKVPVLGGSEHFLPNLGPPPCFFQFAFWGVAKSTEFFAGKGPPFASIFHHCRAGFRVTPNPRKPAKGGLKIHPPDRKWPGFCQFGDFGPLVLAGSWARSNFSRPPARSISASGVHFRLNLLARRAISFSLAVRTAEFAAPAASRVDFQS